MYKPLEKHFCNPSVTQCYLTCHVANVSCMGHLFLVSSHRPSEILGIPRPQGWPNCSLFPYFDAFIYIYIYSNSDIYQNIKYISYFIVLMYSPICSLFPYFDIYIYIYQNNKTNEKNPSNSGLSENRSH